MHAICDKHLAGILTAKSHLHMGTTSVSHRMDLNGPSGIHCLRQSRRSSMAAVEWDSVGLSSGNNTPGPQIMDSLNVYHLVFV